MTRTRNEKKGPLHDAAGREDQPAFPQETSGIVTLRNVLPDWAVRILVLSLLLLPNLTHLWQFFLLLAALGLPRALVLAAAWTELRRFAGAGRALRCWPICVSHAIPGGKPRNGAKAPASSLHGDVAVTSLERALSLGRRALSMAVTAYRYIVPGRTSRSMKVVLAESVVATRMSALVPAAR